MIIFASFQGKDDEANGDGIVGQTNNGNSLPRMEAESLEKETETERPKKDLNEAAVTTSAEVKSSAKNDTLKALKVRGPAWLAFTGKSNVKPDDKLVKPVSVEANGAKQPVKPVSVETNGSTQPVKPVLDESKPEKLDQDVAKTTQGCSKPVANGTKPVIADPKPVLKELKPVFIESKTEGTPKPEPAPLACEEITTKDLADDQGPIL